MSELFSRESTGGVVARVGMEYQDAYALVNFPGWLAQDAFSGMVSELLGDIEVTYFSVTGPRHLCMEAKNHALSQPDFWKEIERFEILRKKNPSVYAHFRYVSPEMPSALEPMRSKLVRLRGVGATYDSKDPIVLEAREEFVQWVLKHTSQTESRARFILDHVDFEDFDDAQADKVFVGKFAEALPALADVPPSRVKKIAAQWRELIATSVKSQVSRRQIEEKMLSELSEDEQNLWLSMPSKPVLQCGVAGEPVPTLLDMSIDLRPYIGVDRASRTTGEWDSLRDKSALVGEFLLTSRPRARVKLNGNLRMSAAVTMGMAFKATKKHALVIEHRGVEYALDDYTEHPSAFFVVDQVAGSGNEGLVAIQLGLLTRTDIERSIHALGLGMSPMLFIESGNGVANVATLNRAVREAKQAVANFRSTLGLDKVHLIIKGPSFFAMALGHRLNGLGTVQLYDWADSGYVRTALLNTN